MYGLSLCPTTLLVIPGNLGSVRSKVHHSGHGVSSTSVCLIRPCSNTNQKSKKEQQNQVTKSASSAASGEVRQHLNQLKNSASRSSSRDQQRAVAKMQSEKTGSDFYSLTRNASNTVFQTQC